MGKKKNSVKSHKIENKSTEEEPRETNTTENEDQETACIDLAALDGYVLPNEEESDHENEATESVVTKPKKKRRKKNKKADILGDDYREKEERRLEELLFGDLLRKFEGKAVDTELSAAKDEASDPENEAVTAPVSENVLLTDVYGQNLLGQTTTGRKPAWVDEDDEETRLKDVVATYTRGKGNHGSKETSETNYREYLQKNFASIHGQVTPKWAELGKTSTKKKRKGSDDDTDEDSDDYDDSTLSKTAANLLRRDSSVLGKDHLKFKRVKDLNHQSREEGPVIKSIDFHKKENVAMVAGNAGVVTLFQVDGRTNAKIQSIKFDNFPLHQAQFAVNGEEFLATSNARGLAHVHNIVTGQSSFIPHNRAMEEGICKDFVLSPDGRFIAFCGRFGYIHLLSGRSKEWITSLKMNGEVHALTFSPDSSRLYSHGEHGEVYIWDVQSRSCVNRFVDDGCILGTALAVSASQQYLACGSSSGVVNIYSADKLEKTVAPRTSPKPDKILLNLVTRTSSVRFHPSSEMMCMFSSAKENAVRLVHFPSLTVFQNFPLTSGGHRPEKKMPRVNSCDFSPNGGYMALGLNNGSAALYRLHHYDQY